jgi:hypothetical protein
MNITDITIAATKAEEEFCRKSPPADGWQWVPVGYSQARRLIEAAYPLIEAKVKAEELERIAKRLDDADYIRAASYVRQEQ